MMVISNIMNLKELNTLQKYDIGLWMNRLNRVKCAEYVEDSYSNSFSLKFYKTNYGVYGYICATGSHVLCSSLYCQGICRVAAGVRTICDFHFIEPDSTR